MSPLLCLRVFLSSPSDVAEERELARSWMKTALPYDPFIRGRVTLDVVSWDDPAARIPMVANLTPQESVSRGMPKPSACDVVVVVLWSRMGTPLLPEIRRMVPVPSLDGTPWAECYLSGTEWEYEDALASTLEPKPVILVYRRTEDPPGKLNDPDLDEKREQFARVTQFFERFRNPDGSLRGSYETYATPDDYAKKLQDHLRNLLHQRLGAAQIGPVSTAAAQARLAKPPVGTIPDPAPLPPDSHVPPDQRHLNPLFVGRTADLNKLAAVLTMGDTEIGGTAILKGLGGVGKTQLANEFVHRYGQYFKGGVFWLCFADPAAVPAEVASCGGPAALNLHADFGKLPLPDQVKLVSAAWQSPAPRLLVFDNCEDEKLLAAWRPTAGGARVLVTSRRREWPRALGVCEIHLDPLRRADSIDLLCRHRPDLAPGDPDLDAIARELGDLPLALHLAGSYLARYSKVELGRPAVYLNELQQQPSLLEHSSMTAGGYSPTGHEQHVARTFALSYDRLPDGDSIDDVALKLLARAACFAPDEPIPRDLLLASLGPQGDEREARQLAEDALGRLGALGLLETRYEGTLILHRLLAAFVREAAKDRISDAQDGVEEAVLSAAERLNREAFPVPRPARHLRTVAEAAAQRASKRAGDLHHELGQHLRGVREFAGARDAFERAREIDQQVYNPDHPNVAKDECGVGWVLKDMGNLIEAQKAFERAREIDERACGPNHLNVARDLSGLGWVLKDRGDLLGARAAFKRAQTIREGERSPNPLQVASDLSGLGWVLKDLGDLPGARAAFERVQIIWEQELEDRKQLRGRNHAEVATAADEVGKALQGLDNLPEARVVFEEALAIRELVYGSDHPTVAGDLSGLGWVLKDMNDLPAAQKAFERALEVDQRVYGADHPRVAADLCGLGWVLKDRSELLDAWAAFERARRIDEAACGPDHPNVARHVRGLGWVLRTQGKLFEARAAFEWALRIVMGALGPHPDVANVLNDVGNLRLEQGELEGARAAFERALLINEQVYGRDHANVAHAAKRLGDVHRELGELSEARDAFERALLIDERVYGADHPEVIRDARNLGYVLRDLRDVAGVRAAFVRAIEIRERAIEIREHAAHGSNDPTIARLRSTVAGLHSNLGSLLRDLGDLTGARESFERALEIEQRVHGPDHPRVADHLDNLGKVLEVLDPAAARDVFERARRISLGDAGLKAR